MAVTTAPPSARVHVAADRVIRITVGLRPFRPSGFVVRSEKLDEKTVIHNYGHGGAGITLSWGTARLAVDLAAPAQSRECAVIGCGVIGLSTARTLQLSGMRPERLMRATCRSPTPPLSNLAGGLVGAGILTRLAASHPRSFAGNSPKASRLFLPALPVIRRRRLRRPLDAALFAFTDRPAAYPRWSCQRHRQVVSRDEALDRAEHSFDVPYAHRRQKSIARSSPPPICLPSCATFWWPEARVGGARLCDFA